MTTPHKARVSYDEPGHAHFVTYSCFHRLALLGKDRSRRWVVEEMDRMRQTLAVDLWAYVVMPEHVHLLLRPRQDVYRMRHILGALKRPVSAKAKEYLIATNNRRWLKRLSVRDGETIVFRFWQAGGGYDRNLWNDRPVHEAIEYIHANPVRRGLVAQPTDWVWSSARFWAGQTDVPLKMDPIVL